MTYNNRKLECALTSLEDCAGKTVKVAFRPGRDGYRRYDEDEIFIVFTDGKHIQLRGSGDDYGGAIGIDHTVVSDVMSLPAEQVEWLGLTAMVQAEKERQADEEKKLREVQRKAADESAWAQYQVLKRRFEGT